MIGNIKTKHNPDITTIVNVTIKNGHTIRVESIDGKEWFEVSIDTADIKVIHFQENGD